jgi:leucyl/phenylalanyl-tRNA--protein transferase
MLNWIDDSTPLPPASAALGPDTDAPGLVAAGGRVTPARLLEAYSQGIFPWYSAGQPVLWWSPDPRMVLPVA